MLSSTFLLPNRLRYSSSSSSSAKLHGRPFKASSAYTTKQPRAPPVATSLYEVLGVPSTATCHDIKAAYRKLARTCHPDVVAVKKEKASSASEFMKIHEAYSTLSDPNKRATYDYDLYGRSVRGFTSSPPSSVTAAGARFSRKKWETDQCW